MSASFRAKSSSRGATFGKTRAPHLGITSTEAQTSVPCEVRQSQIELSKSLNNTCDDGSVFYVLIIQQDEGQTSANCTDNEHQVATINARVCNPNTSNAQYSINSNYSSKCTGLVANQAFSTTAKHSKFILGKDDDKNGSWNKQQVVKETTVTEASVCTDSKKTKYVWPPSSVDCNVTTGGTYQLQPKTCSVLEVFQMPCSANIYRQTSLSHPVLKSEGVEKVSGKENYNGQQSSCRGVKQEQQSTAVTSLQQTDLQTVPHKMLAALSAHRVQEQQALAQKIPETFVTNSLDLELQSLYNTSQPRHGTHIGQESDWQKKASSEVMLQSKKRNPSSVLPSQQNKCIVPKSFPQKLPNTMMLALEGTKIISSSPSQKQQVSCQIPLKHDAEGNPLVVPLQQLGTIKKLPGRSCSVPAKLLQDCKFQAAQHQECKAPSPPRMSLFPVATSTPFFKLQGARSATEENGHHTDSGISMSFLSQCFPTSSNSESSVGTSCSEKASSEESDQLAKSPDDSSQDVLNMTPDDTKDGVDSQNTSLSSMHWLKDFALKPKNSSDNDPQTPSMPLPPIPNTYSRANVGSCSKQAESDAEKTKRPPHTFVTLIKLALATQPMKGMKVKEICKWIEDNFPYYKHRISSGWKSTIRQNLCMYSCFEKVNDPNSSKKNGSYWICKPEKTKSCTPPSETHRSGFMPIVSKFLGLPAYAFVCLPVAPSSASLSWPNQSPITFPESSSVGLQTNAVNALPTPVNTIPVVLPVPKLPIPRIATMSLPAACKTKAWVSADKTKTRNVGNKKSTKVSEPKKCSKGLPGGTDLLLKAWIQTQVGEKSRKKDGHPCSLPATSVPTAMAQSDEEKTGRMCGPCASHFSETVVRSLDFSPALNKSRSKGCSWYRRPFSEEEDSAGFEILTSDEGHLSKSRTRRKQVYPKHCLGNDIADNFLDGEIILTKDVIVGAASSQVFPSKDSSCVRVQPRKRAKMALPVSPVLGCSNTDFFSLPCMPSVNPLDLDCDVAQQHNISGSLGDSLTALPETSTPIRNQPTASLQHPQTSPIGDVLPFSPVNTTFFESMADIFVSASPPHMFLPVSGSNMGKPDLHRGKDLTSSADCDDGFLPELKTPPSRWGWAGRCHLELSAKSGGHPVDTKDEIGLVQNPNDYFEESNLLDMYEAPSFNLSPQHFHLKCSSPCSNNKSQGYPKQTLIQEAGGCDTLVHSLNQSTEFHHQNISHSTGQHTVLAEASRSTLDVNKFCCFIKSVPQLNANSGNTFGVAEQNAVNRESDVGQASYTYQQPQTMTKTTGTNQCKNSDQAILQNVDSSVTQNPLSQNPLVHKSSHSHYHFKEQQCHDDNSFWYNQQHDHSDLGTCDDLYKDPQMTHKQCTTFLPALDNPILYNVP